jgi:AraC-like DNA-binding protein/PAS domain-containing protein
MVNKIHSIPEVEIMDLSIAMVAYWDRSLICRYATEAFAMWFGRQLGTMINTIEIHKLLGDSFQENLPYISNVLEGKVQRFEWEIKTLSGEIKKSTVTYSPDSENGKIDGFFVHIKNIANGESKNIPNVPGKYDDLKNFNQLGESVSSDIEVTLKSCLFTGFPGIAKLSRLHFISESKLKRNFKAKFNMSVFSYYRNLQMELAEKYLEEDRYSKKQLAVIFNFSNPSNFIACYKKYLSDKNEDNSLEKKCKITADRYEIFVSQAPIAMAMLDKSMHYLAISNKWLKDHSCSNDNLIGTVYNPGLLGEKLRFKEIYKTSMRGKINKCDEELIEKIDGTKAWIKWEVRPWYNDKNAIGGLLINTEDISVLKTRDIENDDLSEILGKANEIARIGTWQCDLKNNKTSWSKVAMDILEIPVGVEVDFSIVMELFKKGNDRNLIKRVYKLSLTKGLTFDIEAEITTWTGNPKRIRVISYSEFREGACQKIAGIFQDISKLIV